MTTPQNQAKKLAEILGLQTDLYLKREDLHPYASHKGRSIPIMIEKYLQNGWRKFCVSSSGNAALAAGLYIKDYNKKNIESPLFLKIFVGKHISDKKFETLKQLSSEDSQIIIEQLEAPKQAAFKLDMEGAFKNLRQSTDDTALIGYGDLANELAEIKDLSAVFIPTSSGTTAQGLRLGFQKLGINPQIHIVQTPKCHPLVDNSPAGESVANAIVDTIGYRKNEIQKTLIDSCGKGWIATDEDILEIQSQIKETEGVEISPNSALSLVGLKLAIKNGCKFDGSVVCLITGR